MNQPPPPPPGAQPLTPPGPPPSNWQGRSDRQKALIVGVLFVLLAVGAVIAVSAVSEGEEDRRDAAADIRRDETVRQCDRWRDTLADYRDGLEDEIGLRVRARFTGQGANDSRVRSAAARASDDEQTPSIESAIREMEAACDRYT